MATYSDWEQRQLDSAPVPKMGGMWEIEGACECVGQFGPDPDCAQCGGDGSVRDFVKTLPEGYPEKDAKWVYGP